MEILELKISPQELTFKKKYFNEENQDFKEKAQSHLKCSVCETDIRWMVFLKKQIFVHPFLKVLLCEGCFLWLNESKNWNRTCLFCGFIRNESSNRYCTSCPAIFCQACIKRNFGLTESIRARFDPAWKCVKCKPESLWFARGICNYAMNLIAIANQFSYLKHSTLKKEVAFTKCKFCEVAFESVSELQCKHKYHTNCINDWFKKSKVCPLCRVPCLWMKSII